MMNDIERDRKHIQRNACFWEKQATRRWYATLDITGLRFKPRSGPDSPAGRVWLAIKSVLSAYAVKRIKAR